jgi:3'-phosphoadenosine 5'-phosphosulfate sulfotransferase (PAPS reductase)/FAD synthetase
MEENRGNMKKADKDNVQVERMVRQRAIIWFSCGAASAIALKLAKNKYKNLVAVYCDTGGEHPDNKRFLRDIEKWTDTKITILKNERYKDHFDVYEKDKFLVSPMGARCTLVLKRKLREDYQRPNDIHIFGYTLEERTRAAKFEMRNKGLKTDWILIENEVSKQNCLGILEQANIGIPVMYKLGYNHNNCIGCVKGGKGYWNRIRKDFPDHFNRMAKIERELNIRINDKFLDEMGETEGNFAKEPDITCDIFCHKIINEF